MKFSHHSTSKMTGEEHLGFWDGIKQSLNRLKHRDTEASTERPDSNDEDIFFGKKFYFANMTKEDLSSTKETTRRLLAKAFAWINDHPFKYTGSNVFFDEEFNFETMTRKDLLSISSECRRLLARIDSQLDKLDCSATEPH